MDVFVKVDLSYDKTGNKNEQLVLEHWCKTR